jgi:23S rRNA A2030 N6-methylase RlmJ
VSDKFHQAGNFYDVIKLLRPKITWRLLNGLFRKKERAFFKIDITCQHILTRKSRNQDKVDK